MPILKVTTRSGDRVDIEAEAGRTVMEVLRDRGDVEAACGGEAVCATCHVHIAPDWLAAVGEAGAHEADLLDSSLERRPNSRLGCQIRITAALDGLSFTVAPAEG